jgi:HK97 family phage major capsid protein
MRSLATINEEILAVVKAQRDVFAEHGEALPDDLVGEVEQRNARLADLKTERQRAQAVADAAKDADAEHDYQTKPTGRLPLPTGEGKSARELLTGPERKSPGQVFQEDQGYQDWFARIAPRGHLSEKMRFDSPRVYLPGGAKALLTGASDTSGGAFVFNDVQAGLTPLGRRPLRIRDVVTQGQTSSDTVEFVRVTTETNNTAPVAEATSTSGGVGVKPESDLAFEKVTTPVKTIAHWIAATNRALSDAGQLRTLIDEFLRYGLEEELEDQMMTGDGTGENFTGISNISGTQSQSWDTDILTTLRKAKTKVRLVGRMMPTAYLLHPNDWQTIDLLQDNEARYYFGGPAREGTPTLWGLPVVESEAVPEGFGYVGDFRQCVLWDREDANIMVSNSHSDFFVKNLVAILAELRAAFGCFKPNAIVEADLTA